MATTADAHVVPERRVTSGELRALAREALALPGSREIEELLHRQLAERLAAGGACPVELA